MRGSLLDCPAVDLDLQTAERDGHSVLALRGEIDVYTAPLLRQAILDLVEQGRLNVVIDMTDSHIWDASTVATLDAIERKYAVRGKTVTVIGLNDASTERRARLAGHLGGGH